MYQRIVVGTDGSSRAGTAVAQARQLAHLTGAELHLVQGCGSPVVVSPFGDAVTSDPHETVAACVGALTPLADELRDGGLDVEIHVRPVGGAIALCEVAEQIEADLIVVGNRGMSGARRILGSVPSSVAHHAPCAVLIVATD